MNSVEANDIERSIIKTLDNITGYSQGANLDLFLSSYDNSPSFLHISGDGKMRNYDGFKKICTEYYASLLEQKIVTIQEKIHVMDSNLVIVGWTGDIVAQFKSGDVMKMSSYSITYIFKKMHDQWKIIHAHESSLPPEIIKKPHE